MIGLDTNVILRLFDLSDAKESAAVDKLLTMPDAERDDLRVSRRCNGEALKCLKH
jgi:predicted nucleic-acid-binding protein